MFLLRKNRVCFGLFWFPLNASPGCRAMGCGEMSCSLVSPTWTVIGTWSETYVVYSYIWYNLKMAFCKYIDICFLYNIYIYSKYSSPKLLDVNPNPSLIPDSMEAISLLTNLCAVVPHAARPLINPSVMITFVSSSCNCSREGYFLDFWKHIVVF